ncbi:metallophosphoesterase [Rhodocytophaga aerolata]|uniref:Metallophosphoesterase n=1 Tax=Rhodocytophaga aerolata TaxID=455078 RepID=A0ABT8RJC7_9BACT|nr:metallophosphoesterase [Rhodocytophaga aerolata]MDO1451348.1 metallophosphoesterase [Rhodocytophaga aerolata]
MSLKILHISDIHFKNFNNYQYLDLDQEIQREIELDLSTLKKQYGKIDIVLLGGDIAFSGQLEEYDVADNWIKKICTIIECKEENVLTVPGNHDVDRSRLSTIVKTAQKNLKSSVSRQELDYRLGEIIKDQEYAEVFLRPLRHYNEFAQKYGSIPKNNNILYWEKDFVLDDRILRIRGLNSALVSSELDNENTSKMVLGSAQTRILRENAVIHLVLCHHPPRWIFDGDDAFKDLKEKARIQLFGHKHVFESDIYNGKSLVLAAGAMQPSRWEDGWEPRYNILEISIFQESHLKIKLFKRIWDKAQKKFKADFSVEGHIFEEYNLKLSEEEASIKTSDKGQEVQEKINDVPMAEPVIDPKAPNPKRKLAYLFLGLPYHIKLKIAVDLNLIDDSDKDLLEVQKAQKYFKRATERGLLEKLWEEVNKATGSTLKNPFAK